MTRETGSTPTGGNSVGEGATPLDTAATRPDYYGGKDNPYEVIKVLEAWLTPNEFYGWLRGTIIKYQARPAKAQAVLDAEKCAWYSRYLAEWQKRTGYVPAVSAKTPSAAALSPAQNSEAK